MNNALFGDAYDIKSIMQSFSDFVVSANPMGVAGGKNDDQLAKAIHQGIDYYKRIGIVSMNIISKEITMLDDFHAIAKIFWSSFYGNENTSGEIPFEVVYLVQCKEGVIKIFAYVTGDEQAAFKAHRLLPESQEYGAEH
ncbi:MAG: hypothetical protein ACOYXT_17595 [Bacteroidota bacterium]